ncbi:hypothetical protein [Anaerococcus sp. Marseille-P3915]|uniref:hypothetical protein n=1 Tax=Anaerococcus sp. Marseille-P3915 TaxID=2057799 RepID=UPI000D0ADBAF|nr:hypothetical protein [Anaerococcus sp. Marseille-P3915]
MIIKENLLKDSARERHKSNEAGSAWGAIIFYINNLGLEHGKEYTISFEVKNLSKQSNGLVGVFVTSLDGKKDTFSTSLLVNGRISATFTYDKDISDKIGLSPGPVGDAARCEATFLKAKLAKGKIADEYIPNKEDVKPENQAIFPIGGVSRSLPSIEDIRGLVYVN